VEDCYHILGVKSSASGAEIKRAFRRKAKEIHPDLAGNMAKNTDNDRRMRDLIHAYETLSDLGRRAEFDATYSTYRKSRAGTDSVGGFDYRLWLMERKDKESRAKLIFFDLLHGLEDEAIAEYGLQRASEGGFVLSLYFDREDFMDCGFILAEELSFRDEWYESFLLLTEVIRLEQARPYFRHFFPDVLIFVRDIIRTHLVGKISDELALDCLETALELKLGKKEDANILKLMALCYERIGDRHMARLCLGEALRRDSRLTGTRELQRKLET